MPKIYKTPGVYVEEQSAFPSSIVPIETALPAFVGYTQKAVNNKRDITLQPTRITSLGEFVHYFGGAPKTTYSIGNIRQQASSKPYQIELQDKRYLLFYSLKLFFANGGSTCYIVSVGDYNDPVAQSRLEEGIQSLEKEREPTILLVPDAVLLERQACYALQQSMLAHCGGLRSRLAILDIFDGFKESTPENDVISTFRLGIGREHLTWGAAYYPWVATTIIAADEVDFTNIDQDAMMAFIALLEEDVALQLRQGRLNPTQADQINVLIEQLPSVETSLPKKASEKGIKKSPSTAEIHRTLLAVHPLYKEIMQSIREELNLLPPSGGMAGIYTTVDRSRGVWQAPANVSLGSVVKPVVDITNQEQEDLNAPPDGKAVNAIRTFPGRGVLVWGARTLDGNNQEWRYINVRRTAIFIEQSVKYATEAYVFEPNDANTWATLQATIDNFLLNIWRQGGLAGAKPEDAFFVRIGLGSTMTSADIVAGWMRINIGVAITRPAEFIVIALQQKMPTA